MAGDVLTKLLIRGAEQGLIKGVAEDFRPGGIVSLQYADDTIIFSDVDPQYTKNLKSILIWFKHLSGMRINFHKSELIP